MQASERMVAVRISYKKLWMLLLERDIKKASLRHEVGLSAGTWTKLNKGEEVSLSILLRICDYLNCDIGDICEGCANGQELSPVFRTALFVK